MKQIINKKIFFDEFRKEFNYKSIEQSLVDAFDAFLGFMETDDVVTSLPQRAYMLATAWHETGATMLPIKEKGGKPYFIRRYWLNTKIRHQLGNKSEYDAYARAGRGYVQVTGLRNDTKLTEAIKEHYKELVNVYESSSNQVFNLVEKPEQALNPEIAYACMSWGMSTGLFTGKSMDKYIDDKRNSYKDYCEARRVVNGVDKKAVIANYALKFEKIIRSAMQLLNLEVPVTKEVIETKSVVEPVLPEVETQKIIAESSTTMLEEPIIRKAIVKPEGKGFWSSIRTDIAGLGIFNGGFAVFSDWIEQLKVITLSQTTLTIISIIIAAASITYLIIKMYHYYVENKREELITKELISMNSAPNTIVTLVEPEMVDFVKQKGVEIIYR